MSKVVQILAFESSCDDTSVALLRAEWGNPVARLEALAVQSQFEVHEKYGGVVPELASRAHLKNLLPCLQKVLSEAGVSHLNEVDCFVSTQEPGLVGSLLIGHSAAKTLAFLYEKPFVGCNHIEGHLMSIHLESLFEFPYLAAVVSGGHSSLFCVSGFNRYETLGVTLDDAAGEAFDKGAKLLGLGFPGGPEIDKVAVGSNEMGYPFSKVQTSNFDMSFSGLKSELMRLKQREGDVLKIGDAAASYQRAILNHLLDKIEKALEATGLRRVAIVGGVARNSRFRARLQEMKASNKIEEWMAPRSDLCTDNAAMIGLLGYHKWMNGDVTDLSSDVKSTTRPSRRGSSL